jgi:hypothetical protein
MRCELWLVHFMHTMNFNMETGIYFGRYYSRYFEYVDQTLIMNHSEVPSVLQFRG